MQIDWLILESYKQEKIMYRLLTSLLFLFTCSCVSQVSSDKISLKNGDQDILVYNTKYLESPKKDAPWFGRSGFIHPVLSPKGQVLTTPFPSDHLHQHGIMFAWTSARIDGRKVDFWNSKRLEGKVEHVKTISVSNSKIVVELRHIDLKGGNKPVLSEIWEITKVEHPTLNIFDLKSTQNCLLKDGLNIAKYHYGALCLRSINGFNAVTSDGNDRIKGNHSRPDWVAFTGQVNGETCGIAGIQHKRNFRYPQPVRIHPQMPYFCFAPMVLGDFKLEYGKPYVSEFRFVAFDGEVQASILNKISKDFNHK